MLLVCRSCHRHVRRSAVTCPFCASRAGLAAAMLVVTGCGGASEPASDGTTGGETETVDAGTDAGTTETTERGPDDLGLVAAYGAPAPPPGPSTTPPP